ncbi:MAG: transposase [Candidatus Eremiobacteraeota bacterium]|nr:transposase [Candidatus Eremiobacteraeota bacterium]
MGTSSNGSRSALNERGSSVEVVAKPKRRRFPIDEKLRILRGADACSPGTLGAYLRREGIYSSQLYAWRRERERGDLDALTLRSRAKKRKAEHELESRNHQLEVENRKLQRKIARLELFEEIRKKATGLLGLELKSAEFDESD